MEDFIQSRQNPRIKALSRLQERSGRKKLGRFVVEGLREVSRCIEAGIDPEEIYFCPELFKSDSHSSFIDSVNKKIPCCRVADGAFEKISNREGCDGILAVCLQWGSLLEDIKLDDNKRSLVLVADSVEKPGNLGALLRTADAVGAKAVILSNSITDIFNPSVVRASQGAMFNMQIADSTPDKIFAWLKANKFKSYAAELTSKKNLWDCKFDTNTAIWVGSEKDGLPEEVISMCDETLKIPMMGLSDSLNVNIAASIISYEFLRQNF